MLRCFSVFLFVCISVFQILVAQTTQNLNMDSIIQVDTKTINYGTITQYSNGTRVFNIKNISKEPVVISNCKASCGCTVPLCPKYPVAPGEETEIEVTYDTKRVGSFGKSIRIITNKGVFTLGIKGTVTSATENTSPIRKNSLITE